MTKEEFDSLKTGDSVIFTDKDRGTNTLWGKGVYNKVLTVSSKCYDFITAEENSDYIFHYAWISLYDNAVVN
jgi:hypothetical protein